MSGKNELKSIAIEVNMLLSKYIDINDASLKFSWRKIIPLPFIFQPIIFSQLCTSARQILSQLENCNQNISNLPEGLTQEEICFADFLSGYCVALIETVSLLAGILEQLRLKSEHSKGYSLAEHNKRFALYKEAVDRYMSMGDQLNELYQEIA
ncbi:MAG TPA: hypothetical protein DIU00_07240 [Phycisphaerales bacterium]|nr:hypothetical protein [Phycisphaerales bacterium]